MSTTEALKVIENDPDVRILRRVPKLEIVDHEPEFVGAIIDIETTDLFDGAICELGIILFGYTADNKFTGAIDAYESLVDPGVPVSKGSFQVNGITDEMLAGQTLDIDRVKAMLARANVIVAHNASFDRPYLDATDYMPRKAWACSLRDIDWREHGINDQKLPYILHHYGMFFDAHRALDDCNALLYLLSNVEDGKYMNEMLEHARATTHKLFVHGSFDLKDELKAAGYKWNNEDAVTPKTWWKEFSEEDFEAERERLNELRVQMSYETVTAYTRWN